MGKLLFKGAPEGVKEALYLSHRLQNRVASIKDIGTISNESGRQAVSKAPTSLSLP